MAPNRVPWFYFSHGRVFGPVGIEGLVECWIRQDIDDHSLIWRPGMTEWRPYSEFSKLVTGMGRLPKGIALEHISVPPPPQFQDPELTWAEAAPPPLATQDPSVLLARAALVRKASASWPEALRAIRRSLFLPSARSACQLWIAPGLLAAVRLGLKRSIGLLSYPIIGTIGIPTGKEEGGLLFQITSQGVRFAVVDTGAASFAFLAVETIDSYIGLASLDYRAFTQPDENRKLIKTAARAYDALGLQPEVERSLLVFTEKLYNRPFALWAARVFGGTLR